ncbi:hypothetical protein AMTRI_Chr12g273640 [Amborella trichopoda]
MAGSLMHENIIKKLILKLQRCNSIKQLKQIQASITTTIGLQSSLFSITKLIEFCALSHHGCLDYALILFDRIKWPTTFLFNTVIRGFAIRAVHPCHAISLYRRMLYSGCKPDTFTFPFLLKACSSFQSEKKMGDAHFMNSVLSVEMLNNHLVSAKMVHTHVVKMGFHDLSTMNSLIHGYSCCDSMERARQVFDEMGQRDVVSWNSVLAGYARNHLQRQALDLFLIMPLEPNETTALIVLSVCSVLGEVSIGRKIETRFRQNQPELSISLMNSLIDLYVKCGDLGHARRLFDEMPARNLVSWNILIDGYINSGMIEMARHLFERMPDRDIISWTSIISGYIRMGNSDEASKLFEHMLASGQKPDEIALLTILSSCANTGSFEFGRFIHTWVDRIGSENRYKNIVPLGNALIDMYSKCGCVSEALTVFDKMAQKNVISWNSMISGYANNGLGQEALDLFSKMRQAHVKPNGPTFIGVLSACSHTGLVSEGLECYELMNQVYGISPTVKHYGCMVDLLGRAGLLEKAHGLVKAMPLKGDACIWRTLLGACVMHGDVEMAESVIMEISKIGPGYGGDYVVMANLYASKGRWADAERVRNLIDERRTGKTPGCSFRV